MWQQEVQDKANCYIADIDEMLQPVDPLLAALRYLALLYQGRQQDAMGILTMKQGRKRTEQDLERPYYKYAQDLPGTWQAPAPCHNVLSTIVHCCLDCCQSCVSL